MTRSSKKLSDCLQAQIARGSFPGAQYVVGQDRRIISEGALGFAVVEPERIAVTPDTIYDLASLTKPLVTSLLAVIFAGLGLIDLSAPVGDYLSEFDEKRKRHVTLTRLLTHVSGLPNWRPLYLETTDSAHVPAYISGLLDDSSGTEAAPLIYSDLNYILLGCVLERVSGERLDRLAQKKIFGPLGLKRTMFNPPPELRREIAARCMTVTRITWAESPGTPGYFPPRAKFFRSPTSSCAAARLSARISCACLQTT
jgi:CubicO group peptidase (beta-lactamase class C family)